MSYSPRRTMIMLADPDARAALQLQPKCCRHCGKPLGECNGSELRIGEVVVYASLTRSIVFFCDKNAGGCGGQNRWDAAQSR